MMDLATTTLNNRFEILQPLRDDGKTLTYLALDTYTGKKAVLKELNLGQAADWKSIELFERESQILRHLDHPAIPSYIDTFHLDDGTRLFTAQNYIPSESLASLLAKTPPFDENQTRDFLTQMLDILSYLHSFSPPVIHRDIKPSNILRDENNRFHLVDFGAVQTITHDKIGGSTIVGTSGYMPPEQLMGRAQPATDIYALAATCVHLASGIHPINLPVARLKLQFRDHVSLSKPLCDILTKMLEPDVSARFTRPEQVQNALKTGHIDTTSQALTASPKPAFSTALTKLDNINALIASAPTTNTISDVQLTGDTLSIHINIPSPTPWLPLFAVALVAILAIATGFSTATTEFCCVGFPLLFAGLPLTLWTIQGTRGCGSEKLILSPTEIQLISGSAKRASQPVTTKKTLQLPTHKLTNCYLEADTEKAIARAKNNQTGFAIKDPKSSGIYFVDDEQNEHYFRTTGITRRGKIFGPVPDALPEIQWLYNIVQTYLQTATTPQPPENS